MIKTIVPLWFYIVMYVFVFWHHYTFKVLRHKYLSTIRILFHSLIVASAVTAFAFLLMR